MITLPSGRKIGEGEPPFIIAEVGSNWRRLDDCLLSIRAAKVAGADAVKFQAFNHMALYGHRNPAHTHYDGKTYPEEPHALQLDWLPKLKAESDHVGIEFMCTAFSPDLYDAVDPFVSLHKVASAECTHVRILERVRSFGKPVLLSTGAHGEADISNALAVLRHESALRPLVLLYCVANYPAQEVELEKIDMLRERFGTLAGYSDHTTDGLVVPYMASLSADVLEKHFTAIPEVATPDRPHSITPEQFKRMVDKIQGRGPAPTLAYQAEETPMLLRHNRRLICTRDVRPGDRFLEGENFGIYRSLKDEARGLSPFAVNQVHASRSKRHMRAGDAIGPGDFE